MSSDLVFVNPSDKDWTRQRYVLWFGAYGSTRLVVWANHLEDALDEAVDWIEEHAPGLLADEQVREAYVEALAEAAANGEDPEDEDMIAAAQQVAERDTTCAGNHGRYINSWEWGIVAENPTRADILELQGRQPHSRGGYDR